MMNEEQYLSTRMGKRNPFTVPEGYFEQLTAQVMDQLPEKKPAKVAVMKRIRPWLYAAACVCVGVFIAAIAFNRQTEDLQGQQQMANVGQENVYYSDSYIDEAADYAMIDNQEIYSCLLADMY